MENEIRKLVNVLRRISRAARYAAWSKPEPDAIRFCVTQYNKVRARLIEIEPHAKTLFLPLSEDASVELVRIAAAELAAYFEDEAPEAQIFRFAFGCGPRRMRVRTRGGFRTRPAHCA